MTFDRRTLFVLIFTGIVSLTMGCATFLSQASGGSSGGGAMTYEEISRSDDLARVKSICNDPSTPAQTRSPACRRSGELMAARMEEADCSGIDAYWEEASKMGDPSTVMRPMHETYGIKLAECDRWEPIFTRLMPWGAIGDGAKGTRTISAIAEAGHPVEQKFLTYVSETQRPLDIEHADRAASHYLAWQAEQSDAQPCSAYLPLMSKLEPEAAHTVLYYFKEQACEAAAPVAVEALSSEYPSTRKVACRLLGKVGDASHLEKVQIVAKNDGYSEIYVGGSKGYPVRDACSQAASQIQLRQ